MVSPYWASTAPCDCLARRPVSSESDRPANSISNLRYIRGTPAGKEKFWRNDSPAWNSSARAFRSAHFRRISYLTRLGRVAQRRWLRPASTVKDELPPDAQLVDETLVTIEISCVQIVE